MRTHHAHRPGPREPGPHHHHHRDAHGNPADLASYLARLEAPDRMAWQRPDDVVKALGLRRGHLACDVGAGPGYFAIRMALAVGASGRVHAIDVEPRMVELLAARAREAGVENVNPILAEDGTGLPPEPVDVVLIVNTFHHFPDGVGYLRALAGRLRPGGRIVNVDFQRRRLPVGPPPEHKVSRASFLAAARRAGLRLVREETFLRYQYFLVLEPGPSSTASSRSRRGRGRGRGSSPVTSPSRPTRGRSRP